MMVTIDPARDGVKLRDALALIEDDELRARLEAPRAAGAMEEARCLQRYGEAALVPGVYVFETGRGFVYRRRSVHEMIPDGTGGNPSLTDALHRQRSETELLYRRALALAFVRAIETERLHLFWHEHLADTAWHGPLPMSAIARSHMATDYSFIELRDRRRLYDPVVTPAMPNAMPVSPASPAAGPAAPIAGADPQRRCESWLRALAAAGEIVTQPKAAWAFAARTHAEIGLISAKAFARAWGNVAIEFPAMKKPGRPKRTDAG